MGRVLLILTTSTYKAQAFLDACRSVGVDVTVASERPQALSKLNPQGHLVLRAGSSQHAIDRIECFAEQVSIDAIVAADDEGALIAAGARARLGLAGNPPAAVAAALDKLETRRALATARLPTPWFQAIESEADLLSIETFPCVVKPFRQSAGWGVMRADTQTELVTAWRRLTMMQAGVSACLVEGFLPGAEVAIEGILQAGELHPIAIFDKPDPLDGPFFQETLLVSPSRHEKTQQREMLAAVAAACTALGLIDGPIHAELRIANRPILLEVAPRSIGGLCSRTLSLIRNGRSISLEEVIVRRALGEEVDSFTLVTPATGVMMIPILEAGELRRVAGLRAARAVSGITDIAITTPLGARVLPPPEGRQYLGFIFARGKTAEEVDTALRSAHDKLRIEVE